MEEFLSGTGLSAGLIPGLTRWVGREWTALRILLLLLGRLKVGLMGGLQGETCRIAIDPSKCEYPFVLKPGKRKSTINAVLGKIIELWDFPSHV